MVRTDSKLGRIALMVAHCAGMVDLVALPVWVGTLISRYGLDPQQAGGLVTLFLAGAVVSSLVFAPRFNRIRGRLAAPLGFVLAAAAFFAVSNTTDFLTLALLHALAGLSAGCGLSFTHGTIGRSANPHRLFAVVGIALGIFAIVFFAAVPQLIAKTGGPALFVVFGCVMLLAAVVGAFAFPVPDAEPQDTSRAQGKLAPAVWFAVFGVACMGLVQAMMFSFVERIGTDSGFGFAAVSGVLIAIGFVNLTPAPLAVLLQRRLAAHQVVLAGPVLQAVLALFITQSSSFVPYAVATAMLPAIIIFTHTFAFGLLARLDPSGRAVAATPAMLMIGAAIGPVLGGTLTKVAGYGSLGLAAVLVATLAVFCFWRARPQPLAASASLKNLEPAK
ncbi:MAG: MFS transporter [Pseudomonadota bacterium]